MLLATPTPATKRTRHHYHLHVRASADVSNTLPSRPNLGPLKSVFTPPPSCSVAALECGTCNRAWRGVQCMNPGPRGETMTDNTQCWPTATKSLPPDQPIAPGFYSPGLECPAGYTSACTAMSQTSGDAPFPIATAAPYGGQFQFALEPGETAVGCCPNGYACGVYPGSGRQSCSAVVTSSLLGMDCISGNPMNTRVQAVPFATISAVEVWAPLVQINWRSSDRDDVAGLPTDTPTDSRNPTTIPTLISSSQSPPTHPASAQLSTTAKAGISVAVVSAVIFVLSVLMFFCIQQRKRRTSKPPGPYNNGNSKVLSMSAFSVPVPERNQPSRSEQPTIDLVLALNTEKKEPPIPLKILVNTDDFGRGLKVEDALESPIDEESPFRLKRYPTKRSEKGWGRGISAHPLPDDRTGLNW